MNLGEMLDYALEKGHLEDAITISEHYRASSDKVVALAKLYDAGVAKVIPTLFALLEDVRSVSAHHTVTGILAKNGVLSAIAELQTATSKTAEAVQKGKKVNSTEKSWLYPDLVKLHAIGNPTALETLEACIGADERFKYSDALYALERNGLEPAALNRLARLVYERNPSVLTRRAVLRYGMDEEFLHLQVAEEMDTIRTSGYNASTRLGSLIIHLAERANEKKAQSPAA